MFITKVLKNSKFDQKLHFSTFLKTLTKQENVISLIKNKKRKAMVKPYMCVVNFIVSSITMYNIVVYIVPHILCITLYVPTSIKVNVNIHIIENFLLPYKFQTFMALILI
jgi:hypothetical protein